MAPELTLEIAELKEYTKSLYHCADCSYCVDAVWEERHLAHVCPTLEHHSSALSYSGRGYISLARALLEGEEFPLEDVASRVFTCTSCGNCDRACPIGLSPKNVNLALRTLLVNHGAAPSALKQHYDQLPITDPALMLGEENSQSSVVSLDAVDTLIMPGCSANDDWADEFRAYYQVITSIKPNSTLLGASSGTKATCCGAVSAELGDSDAAQKSFDAMTRQTTVFPRLEQIIHLNPQCYARCQDDNRVIGFASWLRDLLLNEQIVATLRTPVPQLACMNSCRNARENHIIGELLEALGAPTPDSNFDSQYSMCCGARGAMPEMAPKAATDMALAAVRDTTHESCAELIINPDPACLTHLRNSLATQPNGATVMGLGEFVATYFDFRHTS